MIIDRSEESDRMRLLFFFKQKTAYEMRISDWSSDVCSSDLEQGDYDATLLGEYVRSRNGSQTGVIIAGPGELFYTPGETEDPFSLDRKRVVSGKSVSVRVDLGGRRIDKNKIHIHQHSLTPIHITHERNNVTFFNQHRN